MDEYTTWRDFDLRPRLERLQAAFERRPVTEAEQVPLIINTPTYFSFGSLDKPHDYYTKPAAMLAYQAAGFERHLRSVDDDLVPYFMPWLGTGVLASMFGADIRMPQDPADDPAVAAPCIHSPADIARLKLPDPQRAGWGPRVLDCIDYARRHGDLPVGLTDLQGPLDTIGQLCGQARLYEWMRHEPQAVHDLFDLATEAFIAWVKIQKEHTGEPPEWSHGLQGVYSPGCGVWESDDDLTLIGPELYAEFAAPRVERICAAFGGGSVHYCGNGSQHLDTFAAIPHLSVINNSPLGNFEAFHRLARAGRGRVTIQIQDAAPVDPESYYDRLFAGVDDFRGLMLATFVLDNVGMDQHGGYMPVSWDPLEHAARIARAVRAGITRRLAGGLPVSTAAPAGTTFAPPVSAADSRKNALAKRGFDEMQAATLQRVHDRLVDFDAEGLKEEVAQALQLGLAPFDIILHGLAEGMQTVGRLYEQGEYFLPELVLAGSTMQAGMETLSPALKAAGGAGAISKGKVVLGTVKGDLHDIGKNLVRTMLEGAQFEVIDLGVDVPPDAFVQAVRQHRPRLLAMSALLTTTLKGMQETMEALRQAGLAETTMVMIGGAPVSREFADRIGAPGYADSAVSAVAEAERLAEA